MKRPYLITVTPRGGRAWAYTKSFSHSFDAVLDGLARTIGADARVSARPLATGMLERSA